MDMKKRLVIVLLVFFVILMCFKAESAAPICHSAEFAEKGTEDNKILSCSLVSDGLCPEDYGDWSSCEINQNTGGNCDIPDIDCRQAIPEVMFVDFPGSAVPGEDLTIKVQGNKGVFPNHIVLVRDYGGGVWRIVGNRECNAAGCVVSFNDPSNAELKAPATGGVKYEFMTFYSYQPSYVIRSVGFTTPVVNIINPADGCEIKDTQNIDVSASSKLKISRIEYSAEVDNGDGYLPVDVNADCGTCNVEGCNVFSTHNINPVSEEAVSRAGFESTNCGNDNVRINATAYDMSGNNGNDMVVCKINNAVEGCPGCTFASKLLGIEVARVTVWT